MTKAEKVQILTGMRDALRDMILDADDVDMREAFTFAANQAHISITRALGVVHD